MDWQFPGPVANHYLPLNSSTIGAKSRMYLSNTVMCEMQSPCSTNRSRRQHRPQNRRDASEHAASRGRPGR
jgi:hypothetical protein